MRESNQAWKNEDGVYTMQPRQGCRVIKARGGGSQKKDGERWKIKRHEYKERKREKTMNKLLEEHGNGVILKYKGTGVRKMMARVVR